MTELFYVITESHFPGTTEDDDEPYLDKVQEAEFLLQASALLDNVNLVQLNTSSDST